jgi:hypothetical protein
MRLNIFDFAAAGAFIGTVINLAFFIYNRDPADGAGTLLGCGIVLIFVRLAGIMENRRSEHRKD